MSLWLSLLALAAVPALVVAGVLLWVAANALFQFGRMTGEAALVLATLGRALRTIYEDTVRQPMPSELRDLLGKLTPITR